MPRIKIILCSGIRFFYITALTAQALPPKNKTLSNVVGYQVYQQKLWNLKQLPKNSVLYQYNSKYIFHHDLLSNESLSLSPTNNPFTQHSSVRFLNIPESDTHLTTSEKLQLHLQKNLLQPYFLPPTSCHDPNFYKSHEANITFFKYQ